MASQVGTKPQGTQGLSSFSLAPGQAVNKLSGSPYCCPECQSGVEHGILAWMCQECDWWGPSPMLQQNKALENFNVQPLMKVSKYGWKEECLAAVRANPIGW